MKKYNFTTQGYISLLNTNEEEAINIIQPILEMDITTTEVIDYLGCSWCSISGALKEKGYEKQKGKGKGLIRIGNKGEIKMNNEPKTTFTEEEILFLKELYKNKDTKEELNIKAYEDCAARTIFISKTLWGEFEDVYKNYKQYKKQDILNEILRLGMEALKK